MKVLKNLIIGQQQEKVQLLKKKGSSDLLLLIEEEFTPFESALMEALTTQHEYAGTMEEYVKEWADVLLDLAEKQLEKKFRTESFRQEYEQALGDSQESMLKSVPMWKYLAKGNSLHSKEHMYLRRGPRGSHKIVAIVMGECDYIDIKELDKLPKEE